MKREVVGGGAPVLASAALPLVKDSRQPRDVNAVEVVGLTKTYPPAVRALRGVTARFVSGRVSVVLGANGSGKSTLLAILGTLATATSGKVSHGAVGRSRATVRRSLGWVGHDAQCYADLTGRENIELTARLYGVPVDEAFEVARQRFSLGVFVERPFRTYSRGQRQRVALARALVHEPRLLLLDEPTTGLDREGVSVLSGVMREEATRGAIVVVVTHDEELAGVVGDERLRLERGEVTEASAGVRVS